MLTFTAGGTTAACTGPGLPRPKFSRVFYDRQNGIVRMESVTGGVWELVR
ncbi:hypothetical protein LJ737_14740 [Hymenobacter sp. 15J16-1T3B]|nr:hypothetical protein [Hymenobacter sp. 15J16-1T3B]MCC3158505.1 hypothetical protein [Hymenobacter sp. 15J16-1T3B]